MHLFQPEIDPFFNFLPKDGVVNYYPNALSGEASNYFFDQLLNKVDWENDRIIMFGKIIVTKRKVAWYGDNPFSYTYSHMTKQAVAWTPELLDLKQITESITGETYNSCLLNLYHNGEEAMSWHADDEKELKINGAIASVSLGAERIFEFKHKQTHEIVSIQLRNGSVLLMKDTVQSNWVHRLPPSRKVKSPRINLTFRTIVL